MVREIRVRILRDGVEEAGTWATPSTTLFELLNSCGDCAQQPAWPWLLHALECGQETLLRQPCCPPFRSGEPPWEICQATGGTAPSPHHPSQPCLTRLCLSEIRLSAGNSISSAASTNTGVWKQSLPLPRSSAKSRLNHKFCLLQFSYISSLRPMHPSSPTARSLLS